MKSSNNYALCERIRGKTYRVVRKGSARSMRSARRAAKRDGKPYVVFLTSKQIGDLIN